MHVCKRHSSHEHSQLVNGKSLMLRNQKISQSINPAVFVASMGIGQEHIELNSHDNPLGTEFQKSLNPFVTCPELRRGDPPLAGPIVNDIGSGRSFLGSFQALDVPCIG